VATALVAFAFAIETEYLELASKTDEIGGTHANAAAESSGFEGQNLVGRRNSKKWVAGLLVDHEKILESMLSLVRSVALSADASDRADGPTELVASCVSVFARWRSPASLLARNDNGILTLVAEWLHLPGTPLCVHAAATVEALAGRRGTGTAAAAAAAAAVPSTALTTAAAKKDSEVRVPRRAVRRCPTYLPPPPPSPSPPPQPPPLARPPRHTIAGGSTRSWSARASSTRSSRSWSTRRLARGRGTTPAARSRRCATSRRTARPSSRRAVLRRSWPSSRRRP